MLIFVSFHLVPTVLLAVTRGVEPLAVRGVRGQRDPAILFFQDHSAGARRSAWAIRCGQTWD